METREITARIPRPLAEKMDELAEQMRCSHDWIIEQALTIWIEEEEERHQGTLQALAEIDAGRVIDHELVHAWIESLGTDKPLPPPRPRIDQ